jgi:predicted dehydrogenase
MTGKYLIVSLGNIGRRHLDNLRLLCPDSTIGVLRLTEGAPRQVPQGADAVFGSIEEALAFSPAAAIVCGPASTHLRVATALVQNGVSLLVEKPIAHASEGLPQLLSLARERDVRLMVAYNLRFMPSMVEARRQVLSGAIGRILGVRAEVGQYLPDWRPKVRYQDTVSARRYLGGGALLELSHEIDYLTWMFGMPAQVVASGGRYSTLDIDVEDMVSINLEYDRPRMLANIHLDFLQRASARFCKFIGTEGTLVWDGIAETIALYRADTREWTRTELRAKPDVNGVYLEELSHFLHSVEHRAPVQISGEDGLRVLRIVEAAKRSIATRSAVEL